MQKIFILLLILVLTLFAKEKTENSGNIIRKNIKHFFAHSVSLCTSFLYNDDVNNCNYISNNSKFKIYFDTTTDENKNTKTSLSLRAKIGLPKIDNNLFLTLDKESTQSQENREHSDIRDLTSDDNTRVGLKYYFKRSDDTKIYTKLGAKIRLSSSSDIYFKAGATNLKKFNNFDLYSYINEYYYIKADIFKTQIGSNIINKLNDKYTIYLNNEIRLETHQNETLHNSLILNQYLNKDSMLSYWTTLNSSYNSSLISDSISLNLKYHHMINDWIFYEISPSLVKQLKDKKDIHKYLHINFGFIF